VSFPPLTRTVLGIPVQEGRVPEPWDAARVEAGYLWADADRMLLRPDDAAAIYVQDGGPIILDVADGQARSDYDWLLYATAARAVLTMRGRYNLHATLVVPPAGKAVAILGDSGAGKSTTTAALVERGWRLACDDIVEVRNGPDGPVAHPVDRPLHLSDVAAERWGLDTADGRPLPLRDKRAYVVATDLEPAPLGTLVVLGATPVTEVTTSRVDALQALADIARSADRYGIASQPVHRQAFLEWAVAMCSAVRVGVVRRPEGQDSVDAVADAVMELVGP
jgi:hypothetical protein